MNTPFSIIIADDHSMFLDGLTSILSEEKSIKIVLTAKTGTQVLKYLRINTEEKIDLVITDINMPEMDGIELNTAIKDEFPKVKTLVVSMLEDAKKIKILTEANTNGYISKNAEKTELLKAIKSILNGENYFSPRIKQILMEAMFSAKSEPEISLSKRETEVLKLIAQEFTTQEIADKLFLSKHTIESYRKNLISKLGVRNLAGLTRYAVEKGMLE
ncbi:response regulator transcription factor [Winogradskyella litoriviva]|uniref:Response regulator transcription factor n=1 Tax=Winogradskyella litoriviva TaxID=1220182 RepID=A0ABX2E462_9FLAO|nr:response regulator transcription factor [Winogradskyella litoriviva]NRD22761.1 response regulator transcription factor [Winogradskyella litoriviva]